MAWQNILRNSGAWVCAVVALSNTPLRVSAQESGVLYTVQNIPIAACHITAGRAVWCGVPFTGHAVLQEQGFYRSCLVTAGRVSFCQGPYTGAAITREARGLYQKCAITLGEVRFCSGPFTGQAVIHGAAFDAP
ncbi:hypothetical protein ACI01nite_22770 [Acetobacter cibinongensis]|uniref:Uncharacterized protein n=1 Tax=Acetobacter cibinongensis TaxID=146475 RepID=A0A0D6N638_9PROT|nr:hypothetical protein [Acetobacter cibinongensis]GAN61419.1 hypothetical protein Abci_019_033 [Acetobacter cibinongensis]GEL59675.1 hypothetical protein ACI01nite_22770 [Acetobacter cibinongensis]